jgi:hypothetical protein
VHAENAAPSRRHSNVAPVSLARKANDANASSVDAGGCDVKTTVGAVVSTGAAGVRVVVEPAGGGGGAGLVVVGRGARVVVVGAVVVGAVVVGDGAVVVACAVATAAAVVAGGRVEGATGVVPITGGGSVVAGAVVFPRVVAGRVLVGFASGFDFGARVVGTTAVVVGGVAVLAAGPVVGPSRELEAGAAAGGGLWRATSTAVPPPLSASSATAATESTSTRGDRASRANAPRPRQ